MAEPPKEGSAGAPVEIDCTQPTLAEELPPAAAAAAVPSAAAGDALQGAAPSAEVETGAASPSVKKAKKVLFEDGASRPVHGLVHPSRASMVPGAGAPPVATVPASAPARRQHDPQQCLVFSGLGKRAQASPAEVLQEVQQRLAIIANVRGRGPRVALAVYQLPLRDASQKGIKAIEWMLDSAEEAQALLASWNVMAPNGAFIGCEGMRVREFTDRPGRTMGVAAPPKPSAADVIEVDAEEQPAAAASVPASAPMHDGAAAPARFQQPVHHAPVAPAMAGPYGYPPQMALNFQHVPPPSMHAFGPWQQQPYPYGAYALPPGAYGGAGAVHPAAGPAYGAGGPHPYGCFGAGAGVPSPYPPSGFPPRM
jgi:hypothetical protein